MDEVAINGSMIELPPSRRMKEGEPLGVIRLPGRLPIDVRRFSSGFHLRTYLHGWVGSFFDDGRRPAMLKSWTGVHTEISERFRSLVEEYDRYPQRRRYEATATEREVIRSFLDWLAEQPTDLLEQRPLKRWWNLKDNLGLAMESASLDEIQDLVLEAVGVDAVQLATEHLDAERRRVESAS